MLLRAQVTNICVSTATVFENEGVLDDTCESVFQFLVRYGGIKGGKIERLDASFMVESRRYVGCHNNYSLEYMRIWFILSIKSDLKWCIHLSRSLFLYS